MAHSPTLSEAIVPSMDEKLSRPRPRVPRSPAQAAQIRKQNRRQAYLERHPSYFKSLEHELADPILYDSLIRRFQSAEEREKEGKTKGYSRVLEVDLLRGEAKLKQLAAETSQNGEQSQEPRITGDSSGLGLRTPANEPDTKDEGRQRWDSYLTERFVLGRDEDFDYDPVDTDDSLDVMEMRDEEEAWFNEETPEWASVDDSSEEQIPKKPEGETGIQDY